MRRRGTDVYHRETHLGKQNQNRTSNTRYSEIVRLASKLQFRREFITKPRNFLRHKYAIKKFGKLSLSPDKDTLCGCVHPSVALFIHSFIRSFIYSLVHTSVRYRSDTVVSCRVNHQQMEITDNVQIGHGGCYT